MWLNQMNTTAPFDLFLILYSYKLDIGLIFEYKIYTNTTIAIIILILKKKKKKKKTRFG